jgi:hypothetical protein
MQILQAGMKHEDQNVSFSLMKVWNERRLNQKWKKSKI